MLVTTCAMSIRLAVAGAFFLLLFASSSAQQADIDPRVAALVADVSEQRLQTLLEGLTRFRTRHTLSDPDPAGRGIGAAREWILAQMRESSPRLQVSFDTYPVAPQGRITREVELRNVMAILPGRSARRVYLTAHYDSLNIPDQTAGVTRPASPPTGWSALTQPGQDFDVEAPGADDDGSGTALLMELARAFAQSGVAFEPTLVFLAFAGEEQGLVGSSLHAQKAVDDGLTIDAILNNDIVGGAMGGGGTVNGEVLRVFSDGPEDSPSRQLARFVRTAAARYVPSHWVELIARSDRFGRGGDHTPFSVRGFAAVRLTEANEHYGKQHNAKDTLDGVSLRYLAQNARVNAAALAMLALAPPAPSVRDERGMPTLSRAPSGYDARLAWQASPGAAGYRVYWRAAWAPDWEHSARVGNVTEYVMRGVSIDDYVFGVAAIGADGAESLVAAYVSPSPSATTIRTVP